MDSKLDLIKALRKFNKKYGNLCRGCSEYDDMLVAAGIINGPLAIEESNKPECDDKIINFLKWCEDPTDYYGDDLIFYILAKIGDLRSEVPEEHKLALSKISKLSDNKKYKLVKRFVGSLSCRRDHE